MEPDSGLLSESQTFIGVLATVVILCVVANDGNFIHIIFEKIIEFTLIEVDKLQTELAKRASRLKESRDFTQFSNFISAIENDTHVSQTVKTQFMVLKMSILTDIDTYTNRYSKDFFVPATRRIDAIKASHEKTLCPMYVFAYCIVVFLCDEIAALYPSSIDIAVTFLAIFTLMSTVFCSLIWVKFWIDIKNYNDFTVQTSPMIFRISSGCKKGITAFIWLMAAYTYITLALSGTSQSSASPVLLACYLVILIGFSIWCAGHLRREPRTGQYTNSFLLGHFMVFLTLAAILAFTMTFGPLNEERISYSPKFWELKTAITSFIIFFGLVAPLLIPYLMNKRVLAFARTQSKNGEASARWEAKKLENRIFHQWKELEWDEQIWLSETKKSTFVLSSTRLSDEAHSQVWRWQ